ncbi:unnamed protein product [Paramecium sonneborni]|uniref:UEV domain-containing protein n=1 Tax=Paramecium sonneborni TaxID=65129 RepID=A0A8S1LR45_9CILI|nr:unnamed protein product [Paramecium sonneborni]
MAMQEKFPKEQELYRLLGQCAYRNHNLVANDAANILFNYQKLFNPLITQTSESGMIKQLLELKGELPIKYKGQTYSIITSIQFPFIYNDAPAIIRIYNPDISKFSVNQYFIQGASQDQSVVNIHNQELQSWYQHKSIARVMVTLVRELESYFPFFNKVQQPIQMIPPQQQIPYQAQLQQPYQNKNQIQYQQQYPNNANNYYNSQAYNPYINPQQQPQGQPNYQQGNNMIENEQKLKERCNQIFYEDLNQIQNDYKTLHQHHDKLIEEIMKQEIKKNNLQNLENQIEQSLLLLDNENKMLNEFIVKNDVLELNEDTLFQNIKEVDQFSTQILDLYSDIQACKETLHFIVTKFKSFNLPFETVIKLTRKYSEEQFNNILLLKKYTSKKI